MAFSLRGLNERLRSATAFSTAAMQGDYYFFALAPGPTLIW